MSHKRGHNKGGWYVRTYARPYVRTREERQKSVVGRLTREGGTREACGRACRRMDGAATYVRTCSASTSKY